LQLHCNHRRPVATIRLLLCNFFPIFFSSRKKVNEPKENPPCRKTGFRREAHTSGQQRSWPADRPVVDVNGPWPRSKKAHTRKLDEIIPHAHGATVRQTQYYAHAVKTRFYNKTNNMIAPKLYRLKNSRLKIIFD